MSRSSKKGYFVDLKLAKKIKTNKPIPIFMLCFIAIESRENSVVAENRVANPIPNKSKVVPNKT